MKKIILLLVLSFSLTNFAQDIPDDVNTIIVTADRNVDLFKVFGKILLKEGYSLEEADKSFGIIATKPRLVKVEGSFMDHNLNMKIIGEVDSLTIILSANFGDPAFSGDVIDMKAKNTSGSFADAFGELNRLAVKIGGVVKYK